MLDTARYWLAVLLWVSILPAVLWWYLIHPFAAFWRERGARVAMTIVGAIAIAFVYLLWRVREPVLEARFEFDPWLTALGAVLYVLAAWLEIQCRRHLKFRILAGAPELSKDDPGKLLDQGIYGRLRHPRYLSFTLGAIGVALFVNYLGIYLMLAATAPLLFGVVLLEERELRQRFGAAYEEYSRRVPRFLPRLGGS